MNKTQLAEFLLRAIKEQGIYTLVTARKGEPDSLVDVTVDGFLDLEQLADDILDRMDYHG